MTTPRSILRPLCSLALIAVASGCEDEGAAIPPPPPTASPMSSEVAFGEVRRPSRTYYALHEGERCVVHWQQGQRESVRLEIRCPREIEPGEKIRLAGQGCLRESPRPERRTPVRCLKDLIYMREADRTDGAENPELHLPTRETP